MMRVKRRGMTLIGVMSSIIAPFEDVFRTIQTSGDTFGATIVPAIEHGRRSAQRREIAGASDASISGRDVRSEIAREILPARVASRMPLFDDDCIKGSP